MAKLFKVLARRKVHLLVARARQLMAENALQQALRVAEEASTVARNDLPKDDAEFARALNTLAAIDIHLDDYQAAEATLRELVEAIAGSTQAETEEYAAALNNLAMVFARQHRDAEAVPIMEQAIELKRRIFGRLHPAYLGNLQDLTGLLDALGRYEEAVPHFEEMRDIVASKVGEQDPEFVISLHNLALALERAGREDEARAVRQQAEALVGGPGKIVAENGGDKGFPFESERDKSEVTEALRLYEEGHHAEAREIQRRLMGRLPSLPLPAYVQQAMGNLLDPFLARVGDLDRAGFAAEERGDLAEAAAKFQAVLSIIELSLGEHHPHYAGALNNLAQVRRKQHAFDEAKRLFRGALAVLDRVPEDAEPKSLVVQNVVQLYWEIAEEIAPDPAGEGHAIDRGADSDKPADYTVSLRIRLPVPVPGELPVSNVLRWLDARAKFYESLGSFDEAHFLYRHAVELCALVRGDHQPDLLAPLQALASFEISRGDVEEAAKHLEAALALAEQEGDDALARLPDLLRAQAELLANLGRDAAAEPLFLRAVGIVRQQPARFTPAALDTLEENLAVSRMRMDRLDLAAPIFERILANTLAQSEKEIRPVRLQQLATYSGMLGDHERTLSLYEASIEGQRKETGEWTAAFARTLSNYATELRMAGRWAEAEVHYRRAVEIRRVQLGPDHPDVMESQIRLAIVLAALDRLEEALSAAEDALTIGARLAGRLSAMSSDSARLDVFRRQFSLLGIVLSIVLGFPPGSAPAVRRAYELLLRRKALGAEALIVQRTAVLGGRYPHLEGKLHALDELRAEIARSTLQASQLGGDAARQLISEAIEQRSALETELAKEIAEMTLEAPLGAVSVAAIASALPPDAALMEAVRFEPYNFKGVQARGDSEFQPARYLMFIMRAPDASSLSLVDLGTAEEIEALVSAVSSRLSRAVRAARRSSGNPGTGETGSTWEERRLSELVFKPAVRVVADARRLLVSPDGALFLIAFETLPLDEGRLVIDRYEVSYLGAGRDAIRFHTPSSAQLGEPVVVAAPDFDLSLEEVGAERSGSVANGGAAERPGPDWLRGLFPFEPLPGTLSEGEEISKRLSGARQLVGREAVKGAIRAVKRPRVLHFATHGFALQKDKQKLASDDHGMLRSGLALAGANAWLAGRRLPEDAEDGILTAEDVATLDLIETDLAVLSGCETAIGEVVGGEGVFGLRRAFGVAGARSIVMSLWRVPDEETKQLMLQFYDHMLAGKPKPTALHLAKLALRAEKPNPLYWGAFICEGDWHPLRKLVAGADK